MNLARLDEGVEADHTPEAVDQDGWFLHSIRSTGLLMLAATFPTGYAEVSMT